MKYSDPLIKYNLDGKNILIPFSHDLPFNKLEYPHYSENAGRLAKYISGKYRSLKIIDIGANIGDTVFIIKSHIDAPILSIEGDSKYFSLLRKNTGYWKDVEIKEVFIGPEAAQGKEYKRYKGSGHIVDSSADAGIKFQSLRSVISSSPNFKDFKFLKIDTDGFDCSIIKSEIGILEELRPVIFFEYDPYFLEAAGDDGISTFDVLSKAGYINLIVYNNNGDYLLSAGVKEKELLQDLHYYYSGRQSAIYCDICVFHYADSDLFNEVRLNELEFFSRYRNYKFDKPG